MNRDELLEVYQQLSTDDVLELKKVKARWKEILSAENVLALLTSHEKGTVEDLLSQIISNESTEINGIVCASFATLLEDESVGPKLLEADVEFIITSFVFTAFGSENLTLSLAARGACLALLRLAGEQKKVLELFQAHVLNDNCLSLIDCDHRNSQENQVAIDFILKHPSVLQYITKKTMDCFNNDPLLLSNYLIFVGILSRSSSKVLEGDLKEKIQSSLGDLKDELQWTAVSECCYYAMLGCDENSRVFAEEWVQAALRPLKDSDKVSEEMIAFSVKLLCSAATTQHGWEVASTYLSPSVVSSLLKSRKKSLVCSALYLLQCMFEPSYVVEEKVAFLHECVYEAWRHRHSLEEEVRESLWNAIYAIHSQSSLPIVNACISFLCAPNGGDTSKSVREKQVLVAESLLEKGEVPMVSLQGLENFVKKGLYPPGSSGVSAMLAP